MAKKEISVMNDKGLMTGHPKINRHIIDPYKAVLKDDRPLSELNREWDAICSKIHLDPSSEKVACFYAGSPLSSCMNIFLRDGEKNMCNPWAGNKLTKKQREPMVSEYKVMAYWLDKGIQDSPPVPSGIPLYRGLWDKQADKLAKTKLGALLTGKGFQSFTMSKEHACYFTDDHLGHLGKFGVLLRFITDGKTKAICGADDEQELIFSHTTEWIVDEIEIVKGEVITPTPIKQDKWVGDGHRGYKLAVSGQTGTKVRSYQIITVVNAA